MEQHNSTDRKLQLVQMIRAENQENRLKMQSRQKLLNYGNYDYVTPVTKEHTDLEANPFWGMRIRLVLSFLLFLSIFFLDYTNTKIGTFGAKEIISAINTQMDINSIDFIQDFTYTLSDKEE